MNTRAPNRREVEKLVLLALVALVFFGDLWANGARDHALSAAENARYAAVIARRQSEAERDEVIRMTTDSIAKLNAHRTVVAEETEEAAEAGDSIYQEVVAAVPDSMPALRALIVEREEKHDEEVDGLTEQLAIADSTSAQKDLRIVSDSLFTLKVEDERDAILEEFDLFKAKEAGFSTLESSLLAVDAALVTRYALGGTALEGVAAAGITFVVTRYGSRAASKVLGWIF